MSIVTRELDRVSIVPKGAWNNNIAYERLDLVSYNGSSYIAKKDVPINTQISNSEYWKLVAAKGTDGKDGKDGINGTNGTNGTNGEDGNGISSIVELDVTHEPGHIDTYRIIFTNNNTFDFGIYNGINGIDGEAGETGETGATGNGISSVTELDVNHSPGHTDIYSINFTRGDNFQFSVYNGLNGADGTGSVSSVDGIEAIGQDVGLLIFGNNAPTDNTVGQAKQRYYDLINEKLYICTNVNTSGSRAVYTWKGIDANISIDNVLDNTSENPVQNKIIAAAIKAVDDKIKTIDIDTELSNSSENPVQNKVVTAAINTIDNKIKSIDDGLSSESTNPVQNKIIKAAVDAKLDAPSVLQNGLLKRFKRTSTNTYITDYATIGVDFGSLTFNFTLLATDWEEKALTITHSYLLATSAYSYIVSPKSSSFQEYVDCGIYAEDISTNGELVFHCEEVPTHDISVQVLRLVTMKVI